MITSICDLMRSSEVLTVSALTEMISLNLENRFPFVWVRGEVTDLSISQAGHIYFSLKDSRSLLRCVWFASKTAMEDQRFDPFTGEVFETPKPNPRKILRNGLEILCAGPISVYAKSGRYEMLVELVETGGTGRLAQLFEQLKAKYAAAGFFARERKKPLPENPRRVALITSPGGAAIHDFLKLANIRGLSATIRLYPVPVQGEGAAEKIAEAIELANASEWPQVIALIRGGGSTEDLWQFNEPVLAEAVFASKIPIIAGIGHEIDYCLTDLTADARAATPSHAAQLLWPLRREFWQRLDDLTIALDRAANKHLNHVEIAYRQTAKALLWLSPANQLKRLLTRHAELTRILIKSTERWLAEKRESYAVLAGALHRASRLAGFLEVKDHKLKYLERILNSSLVAPLVEKEKKLDILQEKLISAWKAQIFALDNELEKFAIALQSRDPLVPLRKGYALLYDGDKILRSAAEGAIGDKIRARLLDGELALTLNARKKFKDIKWLN